MLRRSLALVAGALVAGALLAVAPAALADPGSAPAPREYRVLQKLHTDAISTFLDDGVFTLGSKADVFEGLGTRLDPDTLWFHIDDASKLTVPAGMEFLAPAGSEVWVAPQSNPSGTQLWPGFSTESVPAGAIDGNETTLRLVKLEGPGDLELFTTGGFGERTRLWSSDEAISTFRIGRTHMHANWAFTRPGTYALTVEGSAQRGGQTVSDTAVYTFVVGPLPAVATTGTALTASKTALALGERVELTGTVTPGSAAGHVEFKAGTTVLGHARATNGTARLDTDGLPVGTHSISAEFVPEVLNLAARSTSAPVTLTVTDGEQPFGIAGVAASYRVGDTLTATVVGATLGEGQNYQWMIRRVGADRALYTLTSAQAAAGQLVQRVDAAFDGYEISARLRTGTTVVAETPWVPVAVETTVEPLTLTYAGAASPAYVDDPIRWTIGGRSLEEGETVRLAFSSSGGPWGPATNVAPVVRDGDTLTLLPFAGTQTLDFSLQVLRDGLVVARSAPSTVSWRPREALVEGVQGVYRPGQAIRATAEVFPAKDGLTYRWMLRNDATGQTETVGTDALVLDHPLTVAPGTYRLSFAAQWTHSDGRTIDAARRDIPIHVSDADPSEQVLVFNSLSAHYHQGNTVTLQLVADPGLAAGDRLDWQWRWPGEDGWSAVPGASGLRHTVTAEQALDGVQVRAVLTFAEGGEPVTAAPVTIDVDDHGATPTQKVTIAGETAVRAGDSATLTATVAPATVLDRYQWYVQRPGAAQPTPIAGATGGTYAFTAALTDDGSEYRVAVVKPGGELAYGPSAPVTLSVQARDTVVEQPIGGSVPATLALTLGAPADFGPFTPGIARAYTATTTATVTSTAGEATLTVADPDPAQPGHLVNGAFALAQPLQGLGTVKTYDGPVANDVVTVAFTQPVAATEPLRTGRYAKTLTFTLSTTTP